MQQPNWPQIPLIRMTWKIIVPLDEALVGKALSISNCSVSGTEETCPVAAHMRKLSQDKNAHKAVMPTTPNPVPHQAQNPVPHPPLNPAPQFIQPPQPQTISPKDIYMPPQPIYAPFHQLPITEQNKLSYLTWVTTNGTVSTSIIDFAITQ